MSIHGDPLHIGKLRVHLRGFKGLKQAIKLEFNLRRYDQVRLHRMACPDIITKFEVGSRTLPRAVDICQVRCHTELL